MSPLDIAGLGSQFGASGPLADGGGGHASRRADGDADHAFRRMMGGKHHRRSDRIADAQPATAPTGSASQGGPANLVLQVLSQILPMIENLLQAAMAQASPAGSGAALPPGATGQGDDLEGDGSQVMSSASGSPFGGSMAQSSDGGSMSAPAGPGSFAQAGPGGVHALSLDRNGRPTSQSGLSMSPGAPPAQGSSQQMSQSLQQLEAQVMEHLQEAMQALQQASGAAA